MIKINDKNEIECILRDLPDLNLIKLSYEKMIHNKVSNFEYNLAIPEGKNMLVWFRIYNNENVCFLLELTNNKEIRNIYKTLLGFSNYLCIEDGTILYGKLIKFESPKLTNVKSVSLEDIYYYKGNKVFNKSYYNKLELIKMILNNDISQLVLTTNTLLLGIPIINTNLNELLKDISVLPYKIDYIKFRSDNKRDILILKYNNITNKYNYNNSNNSNNININNNYNNYNNNITNKYKIFKIIPDIQNDIYKLYNENDEYYDIALIPDYKTSVMMNKLFRNIKENINLDFLEESDDDNEFENERIDKYVDLNKSLKMKCLFNNKFRKWYPISIL